MIKHPEQFDDFADAFKPKEGPEASADT